MGNVSYMRSDELYGGVICTNRTGLVRTAWVLLINQPLSLSRWLALLTSPLGEEDIPVWNRVTRGPHSKQAREQVTRPKITRQQHAMSQGPRPAKQLNWRLEC